MQIYPSILERSIFDFEKKISILLPYFSHFQIDITDGLFVEGKTVQIEELSAIQWTSTADKTFEFHLMVKDYEKEIAKITRLHDPVVTTILIHAGSLNTGYKLPNTNYQYGIVLNPEDEVSPLWETIEQFKIVQLMTVHPGKQGSAFVPKVLFKISELRERGFEGKIILDGAMNDKTLQEVLQNTFLPDAICPGSYFATDTAARLKTLEEMVANIIKN